MMEDCGCQIKAHCPLSQFLSFPSFSDAPHLSGDFELFCYCYGNPLLFYCISDSKVQASAMYVSSLSVQSGDALSVHFSSLNTSNLRLCCKSCYIYSSPSTTAIQYIFYQSSSSGLCREQYMCCEMAP